MRELHGRIGLGLTALDNGQINQDTGRPGYLEPVLDYVLAELEKNDFLSARLFEDAYWGYVQRHADYDAIFGELVPQKLRDRARQYLASEAYWSGTNATAADDWPEFRKVLDEERERQLGHAGVFTGLPKLDDALGELAALTVVGGESGAGKTSFVIGVCLAAIRADKDLAVLFYSLDMSKFRLNKRLLCRESKIDYRTLQRSPRSQEVEGSLQQAEARLLSEILPRMRIVDDLCISDGKPLTDCILDDCDLLLEKSKTKRLFIVVDLLQQLEVPDTIPYVERDDFRLEAIKAVQRSSRSVQQPNGFPVLCISRIRKDRTIRRKLSMEDLLGTSRIPSDADTVLLMWPAARTKVTAVDVVPTTLRIEKGRDGQVRCDIPLWFHHSSYLFTDVGPNENTTNGTIQHPRPRSKSQAPDPYAGRADKKSGYK